MFLLAKFPWAGAQGFFVFFAKHLKKFRQKEEPRNHTTIKGLFHESANETKKKLLVCWYDKFPFVFVSFVLPC